MHLSITNQLLSACAALGIGAAAGILYDILRIARRRLHTALVTAAADLIFWLAVSLSLFLAGIILLNGEQRIFMWIFTAFGAGMYFALCSRLMIPLLDFFVDFSLYITAWVCYPFAFMLSLVKKFLQFFKNLYLYLKKCCIMNGGVLFNERRPSAAPVDMESDGFEIQTRRYTYENHYNSPRGLRCDGTRRSSGKDRRRKTRQS